MSESKFKKTCSRGLELLKKGLSSKFFPFVTAAVMLLNNYVGIDIFACYFVCIAGILIVLLLDDVTPLIPIFLLMNVIVSEKNSPSPMTATGGTEYYSNPVIYIQIIVMVSLWILAMMYRVIVMAKKKQFKPTYVFYGLCALAAVFLLNGVFGGSYTFMNLFYGAIMAFFFLFLFVVLKDNIKVSEQTFIKVAYGFLALSVVLIVELAVTYLTRDVIVDGTFRRDLITYGWGVCLDMGGLLLFCIPSVLYLASKYKYGYLLTAYSLVLLLGILLSTAKQAILGAVVIYPLSLIPLFKKGKNRLFSALIIGAAALIALIAVVSIWDKFISIFKRLFSSFVNDDGSLNGSGRMILWRMAADDFLRAPVFGAGFFDKVCGLYDLPWMQTSGLSETIPIFFQNTVMQFLGSCGIIGLLVYAVHRAQTIACFFSNPTTDRSVIAITLLALLGLSLVDCQIFSLLPTMIYTGLLSVLVASGKKFERKKKPAPVAA